MGQNNQIEDIASENRSPSFVAIDVYAQGKSEYLFNSLMIGILQIPLLFVIHEMITIRHQGSVYEIGYGVVLI